jgi:tetratricopeptide (TPR) repeat protein
MRTFIITLCLGLGLVPAAAQKLKTVPVSNKKTPAAAATKKKPPTNSLQNSKTRSTSTSAKKPAAVKAAAKTAKPQTTQPGTKSTAKTTPKKSTGTTAKSPSKPKPKPASNTTAKTTAKPKPANEEQADDKTEFEKASTVEGGEDRIAALKRFIAAFPKSSLIDQANALISQTAKSVGDDRLSSGDVDGSMTYYKLAIDSAPLPIPDQLFNDSLSKIPMPLYVRGNRGEALQLARSIELKDSNANQLIAMAMFHVLIEDGEGAVRVAEKATKADATSAKAFQTLGLAHRVNFQLDESAADYAKALELDASSVSIKQNLAEIKRALGKTDEAVALYRDLVAADAGNQLARNGLVLSLFDAGKKEEAESELAKSLDQDPKNVMLMASAAYWYAANKDADHAVDLAQKAIAVEPRYIWSHIALARGLMLQNKPLEAEEVLLKAKQFGNFPTLEYEIASARFQAGFYREAAEGLRQNFSLADGNVETKLGGRVTRKDSSFTAILADERRASILEPNAADDADTAGKLKALMALTAAISAEKVDQAAVIKAADAFVEGSDKFIYHRQLYAASLLLNKKIAPEKAFEYSSAAVGNADAALEVPNSGAAVMASELYDSRQAAFSRDELVRVPDVPRQMLAAILRGRVEELVGWSLLQQGKPGDATVRLRRSVSILPDKSAWWRSSMWHLGTALEADGKEPEALDAYIKSYSIDKPDLGRYTTIETLYKRLNGSTEGLEAKIGRNPVAPPPSAQEVAKNAEPTREANVIPPNLPIALPVATTPTPEVVAVPTPMPSAVASATPESTPAATPEPTPTTLPSPVETKREAAPEVTPTPTPEPSPTPLPSPVEIKREAAPEVTPTPTPEPSPTPLPSPIEIKREALPETTPTPAESKPEQTPEPTVTPTPQVTPAPSPSVVAAATPTPTPEPTPAATPEATPAPTPEVSSTPVPMPDVTPAPESTSSRVRPDPTTVVPEKTAEPVPTPREALVAENKPAEKSTDTKAADSKPKPLFDPIVITIPKPDVPKTEPEEPKTEGRARVVEGQPVEAADPTPCDMTVSQERVSLIRNGGTISVLVGVDAGNLRSIRATSSSPSNISVASDSDVKGIEGRRLYVIRSLSENTGVYKVRFQLPCGVKEVTVTVR